MRSFGSDNHSGVHPKIMAVINNSNKDHCIAYGDDLITKEAEQLFKSTFGKESNVFFVLNGTGANSVALQCCVRSFNTILAAKEAHINCDECGAVNLHTSATITPVPSLNGKLTPQSLFPYLSGRNDEHRLQPKVIYISQCTETGLVYTCSEIQSLAEFAHANDMYLHIDGARLANAAIYLNKSLKEITVDCGVDILSFGGTKNGLMFGEAIVVFNNKLSENIRYFRKQSTQLLSKMRFVSCQFLSYLSDNLWGNNAQHANNMAQLLRTKIEAVTDQILFIYPTQANMLFVKFPDDITTFMLSQHFFYVNQDNTARLVTSWDTTEEDINLFINDLQTAYSIRGNNL